MEVSSNPEGKQQLNLRESVLHLIDSARQLASPDKNSPDLIGLDLNGNGFLTISFFETGEPENIIQKLSQRFNFEPQRATKIEISCSQLKLDDSEPVSTSLEFVQEEWKDRKSMKFIRGSTRPSKFWDNPPRRPPQEGLYPVYDRDTIDWTRVPQGTPVNEEKAAKLLEKIQEKVSLISH